VKVGSEDGASKCGPQAKRLEAEQQRPQDWGSQAALRISFDDISFCRYRVIFKISLKYRYRIFFENITRYLIMKYLSILAFQ